MHFIIFHNEVKIFIHSYFPIKFHTLNIILMLNYYNIIIFLKLKNM